MQFAFELESQLFGLIIPKKEVGREVVLILKPNFYNSHSISLDNIYIYIYVDEFWTDSNGMSMQKHMTTNLGDATTLASMNYRPINTAVSMRSTNGEKKLRYII